MKANEFVKKVGWDLAKELADECPSYCNYMHEHGFYKISETRQLNEKHVLVLDLKHLVESHELVERVISRHNKSFKECQIDIHGLKSFVKKNPKIYSKRLKQAIIDVESCIEVFIQS